MIERIHYLLLESLDRAPGPVLCLGDQVPHESTGFSTSSDLFRSLGYESVVDLDYNGRASINHDLNFPVNWWMHQQYALVFDGGTCEHVANIGEALRTMALCCKVGGHVIQESPIVPYGQQYFGIDPQIQRDFFHVNGFERVQQVCHYKRSLRLWLLHALCRLLPKRSLGMVRDRAKSVPGMKRFLFRDTLPVIYPDAFEDRECYYVHPQTRTMYVGEKRRHEADTRWPAMGCYPKSQ